MKDFAYAKINLFLAVTGRRPDGYHDIASVMQTVSLCDVVTLDAAVSASPSATLTCSIPSLPIDSRNLAVRAAYAFMERAGIAADVKIDIDKHIPIAAGLAGGSADCAAVLRMMNDAFSHPLAARELHELARGLGADVPFCLYGGCAVTRGIGDIIEPCDPLPELPVVIAYPHGKISTADAYRKIDESGASQNAPPIAPMTDALSSRRLSRIADALYNVFESVIDADSEPIAVKRILLECGAAALMSGSGPSVFAVAENDETAERCRRALARHGYDSVISRPTPSRAI